MNSNLYTKEFLKSVFDDLEAKIDENAEQLSYDDRSEDYFAGAYNILWELKRKLQLP